MKPITTPPPKQKTTSKLLDWFSVAIFFGFRLIEIIISQSKPIEISVIHTNDPWAEQPKTNCLAKCMVHIGTTKIWRRSNNNNNNEKQILLCALYNNCGQMGLKISKRSQIICKCVCVCNQVSIFPWRPGQTIPPVSEWVFAITMRSSWRRRRSWWQGRRAGVDGVVDEKTSLGGRLSKRYGCLSIDLTQLLA